MLSTALIVLLVVVFIITFVVPLAKAQTEGFAVGDGGGYKSYMGNYLKERDQMITAGNRQYNYLGASLNPILPSFAVAPAGIDDNNKLTVNQYLQQFNSLTNTANTNINQALGNPNIIPTVASPTNMGPVPDSIKAQLPGPNDLLIKARQCETELTRRADCSKLKDPTYKACGLCIDGGTKFNGSGAGSFIGGLLSLMTDRRDQEDAAAGGNPIYQPSLGSCPAGMFYVDSEACIKAVNQLNCKEIGDTGGFTGGRTKEGLQMPAVSCAQAPVQSVYLYQPADRTFDITLRFLAPFGTGVTQAIVTHVPSKRTFKTDNGGKGGAEFTLLVRGVKEGDEVNIMIVQEVPHRPNGKAEVFLTYDGTNAVYGRNPISSQDSADKLCNRLGVKLATKAQLESAKNSGLQARFCGWVKDTNKLYASVQSGMSDWYGIGSQPQVAECGWKETAGAWCYGFKPIKSVNQAETTIMPFFYSFGTKAQPAQGPDIWSQYSDPDNNNPPGISQRAILIQWEMTNSKNRTVAFQPTVTKVNGYNSKNTLRLLGPYSKSSLISGPAWNNKSTMQKNQFWIWSNATASVSATFTAQVPAFLNNPYYSDDIEKAPIGPLISNPASAQLLKTSPCFADGQKPGSYSASCLLELFQGAGGDPAKGYLATQGGGLAQLNQYGDLSAISDYLDDLYVTATTGKDGNGNVISQDMETRLAAMNDAALKLFGFKITNPCEYLVDNADGSVGLAPKPMSDVTPSCLQYLWLNNMNDEERSPNAPKPGGLFSSTYTSIADRFSGLRYNESTQKRRSQYPFQACQVTGTMAPIKNGQPDMAVVGKLSSMESLQAVQNYFNGIQRTANYAKPGEGKAQALAMQQCYGINQIKSSALGYGCTLLAPSAVIAGVTCYINLGDPENGINYMYYAGGSVIFGGNGDTPNIQFYLSPALNGQPGYVSFMTLDSNPLFLRHSGFRLYAGRNDSTALFGQDASFKITPALNGNTNMVSFQSANYPDRYISQYNKTEGWITPFANTVDDANRKSFTVISVPGKPSIPTITVSGPFTTTVSNGITYYVVTGNATVSVNTPMNVVYFAVGGGGGAGNKNGGGGGGVQTNIPNLSKFTSQYVPGVLKLNPDNEYSVAIGEGGKGNSQKNGGNTTFAGPDIPSVVALGGAFGGATGVYCPAGSGGSGGGGCQSVGMQGASTNGANGSPYPSNAGGGAGGNTKDYYGGGAGITFLGKSYGSGANNAQNLYSGMPNSGEGGSSGGSGGSGVFILAMASNTMGL